MNGIGRVCDTHGEWCPDGVCQWCEPALTPEQDGVNAVYPGGLFGIDNPPSILGVLPEPITLSSWATTVEKERRAIQSGKYIDYEQALKLYGGITQAITAGCVAMTEHAGLWRPEFAAEAAK